MITTNIRGDLSQDRVLGRFTMNNNLPKFKIKLGNLGGAAQPPRDAQPQTAQQAHPLPPHPQQQQIPATSGAAPSHGAAPGPSLPLPPAASGGFKIKVKLGNATSLASAGSLPQGNQLLGGAGIKRPAGPLGPKLKKPKLAKPPGTGKPGRPPGTGGGPKRKRIKTDFGLPVPEFAPPDAAGFPTPFQPPSGLGGISGGPAPKLKLKVTASNMHQPKMSMSHIPGMPPPRRRGRPPKNPQNMGDRPPKYVFIPTF